MEDILKDSTTNKYSEKEREDLVTKCWDMLTLDEQQNIKTNEFVESMRRLQNSFEPNKLEEAVENFRVLDKSKYSTGKVLFNNQLFTELKKQPFLEKAAAGICTQVATLTTAEDNINRQKLNEVTANLLVGMVTTKSALHSRNLDPTRIDNNGKINPNLVISIANYAKDNLDNLSTLSEKEQKAVGTALKEASKAINLAPGNNDSLLLATQKAFKEAKLPEMIQAKFQVKKANLRQESFDSLTSVETGSPSLSPRSSIDSKEREVQSR